jgi:hypothetical protein
MNAADFPNIDLVQVAYAQDQAEGEIIQGLLENGGIPSVLQPVGINGPQLGYGLLPRNPQRVMAAESHAADARALLAEIAVEADYESWPETTNSRDLEEAGGREPRNYGLLGAYARIFMWSFVSLAVAFGIFLLFR